MGYITMKFVARISREGDKRRLVIIPRRLHDKVEVLEGLDLLITLQPIVVETDTPRPQAAGNCERCHEYPKSYGNKLCITCITEEIHNMPRPLKGAAKCTYCGIKPAVIEDWCEECTKAAVEAAKVGIEKDLEKIRRKTELNGQWDKVY